MDDAVQTSRDRIRYKPVSRPQVVAIDLDELLPDEHPARAILRVVEQLDFSTIDATYRALEHHPGASAYDPRVLCSLWLLATAEGVSSCRALEERCRRDLAYRWLCGGMPPSYHTLSTFYSGQEEFLKERFVELLALLMQRGLLTLQRVTVDGRKVTANATKASFHRQGTLEQHRQEAAAQVERLQAERQAAAGQASRRQAARQRAAAERAQRLEEAVGIVQQRQQERQASSRKDAPPEEARASETDADARKMKRSHGGYEPSYNVQTVVAVGTSLILAVAVYAQASDNGLLAPMVQQVQANLHQQPTAVLADAGYADVADIEQLEQAGITVYMPPKNERKELERGTDPYQRKRRDTDYVAAWRQRMGTTAAKEVYQARAPVAEGVHAQERNRGWARFRLRGLCQAGLEAVWHSLTHNICVLLARGWQLPARHCALTG